MIAGADALQPGNRARGLAVRGAHHFAFGRARTAGEPLILHGMEYVGIATVAELTKLGWIVGLEAEGKDNSADCDGE